MRIGLILNPNSKKNKKDPTRKERLEKILGEQGHLLIATNSLDEVRPALQTLIREKVTYFLSDGGDGAFHWMVNGLQRLLDEKEIEEFPLCLPTNSGTMNCANHKVGVLGTGEDIVSRLVQTTSPLETFYLPTMHMEAEMVDGTFLKKICFSGAVAGIGPNFFEKYYENPNRGPKTMVAVMCKGLLSMIFHLPLISSLKFVPKTWKTYSQDLVRPTNARVTLDDFEIPLEHFRVINVAAFNQKFAHIIRLFPFGKDGKLHCTAGHLSMIGIAVNTPSLILGLRLRGKKLWDQPGSKLECVCLEENGFLSNFDGEVFKGFRKLTLTPGQKIPIPKI